MRAQLESEIKELQGLLEEASLKAGHPSAAGIPKLTANWQQIDELKSSPSMPEGSAPDLVTQELDRAFNGPSVSYANSTQVNDLTSMVIKKKQKAPGLELANEKCVEDDQGSPEKKTKVKDAAV